MRHILITFVLTILLVNLAMADSDNKQFRSFLNGTSCAQLVNGMLDKQQRKEFVVMIAAFISGSNYAKSRDSKIDLKGMALITEQFCRQNPKKPVAAALIYLDKAIDRRNQVEQKRQGTEN